MRGQRWPVECKTVAKLRRAEADDIRFNEGVGDDEHMIYLWRYGDGSAIEERKRRVISWYSTESRYEQLISYEEALEGPGWAVGGSFILTLETFPSKWGSKQETTSANSAKTEGKVVVVVSSSNVNIQEEKRTYNLLRYALVRGEGGRSYTRCSRWTWIRLIPRTTPTRNPEAIGPP